MNYYSKYKWKCIGRILYFLHEYLPHRLAEKVQIGVKTVELYDGPGNDPKIVAHYNWAYDDVPIFCFMGKYERYNRTQMEHLPEILDYEKYKNEP